MTPERPPAPTRRSTVPPQQEAQRAAGPGGPSLRQVAAFRPLRQALVALLALAALLVVLGATAEAGPGLTSEGRTTVVVFAAAVWAWVFTRIDDTYVALGAALALVLTGVIATPDFFSTLGDDTVWLLLSAFVIAAGLSSSGLAVRATAWVVTAATTPRQLVHLLTAALVVTTFAVPATSGRAALALPVFVALAQVLIDRQILVRALALLFPTVILLSAVGSLLGAGAHLVTSQVLLAATGQGIGFVRWLVLGLPLALVASHLAAEVVLALFTTRQERGTSVRLVPEDFAEASPTPVTGPLSVAESRAALLLVVVVALWCSEPLHGVDPAVVALAGALVATSPRYGSVTLAQGLKAAPWSLLIFLAATLALGGALTASGAAAWLAEAVFSGAGGSGSASALGFLVVVVLVSTAAHLLVQSRSARSSVLVPIVVALAPAVGVDPVAAAFASTAAAGFCHTLPASAKPVVMFSQVEGVSTYTSRDLLRLSAVLAPMNAALVLVFTLFVWPLLGMPWRL